MPDTQFATYPSLDGMPVVVSGGASGIGATNSRRRGPGSASSTSPPSRVASSRRS